MRFATAAAPTAILAALFLTAAPALAQDAAEPAPAAAPAPAPQAYAPPPQPSQQPWGGQPTYREPPRQRDDRYDHDRRRDDDYQYRKKKKRLDIFDIFD